MMQRPARMALLGGALWMLGLGAAARAGEAAARIEGGLFAPMFPASPEEKELRVEGFSMDRTPVTNARFLDFVREHPEWTRSRVSRLFAEGQYLAAWAGDLELGEVAGPDAPVVFVSWFAAKAYCEARGGRLPSWEQWEYASAADETRSDARSDPLWQQHVLAWYSRPNPERLPPVGQGPPNYHGLYDMHGLVWEWVLDFNSLLVSVDSREAGSPDKERFCGAGSLNAADKENYAVFMRSAFLSSLKPAYTTQNLGFRCAYPKGETP